MTRDVPVGPPRLRAGPRLGPLAVVAILALGSGAVPSRAQVLNVRETCNALQAIARRFDRSARDRKFQPRTVVDEALRACRADAKKVPTKLIPALLFFFDAGSVDSLPDKLVRDRTFGAQDRVSILLLCADSFRAAPDVDRAAAFYGAATVLDPGNAAARNALAGMARARGDGLAARRHLGAAMASDPQDPRILASLGRQCVESRDWEGAIRYLEMAVAQGAPGAGTLSLLGDAYLGAGRAADAQKAYRRAIRADTGH